MNSVNLLFKEFETFLRKRLHKTALPTMDIEMMILASVQVGDIRRIIDPETDELALTKFFDFFCEFLQMSKSKHPEWDIWNPKENV